MNLRAIDDLAGQAIARNDWAAPLSAARPLTANVLPISGEKIDMTIGQGAAITPRALPGATAP